MKFLIDNCLSWILCTQLRGCGYDAVHVRDYNLESADDREIFKLALQEGRIIISADTDFGTLLAGTAAITPSVILFRGKVRRDSATLSKILLEIIQDVQTQEALTKGAIIVVKDSDIRIKPLPLTR